MGGQACAIPTVGAPAAAIHMAERPRGTRAAREKSQCSVPKFTKMHPRGAFNVNPSGFTLRTLQDLRCVLLDPPQRNFLTLPKSEICNPQIRPAKFVIRIQNFLVYLYAPRLGPAHCPAESCTVRARKPAGAYARPRAARTLGGLFRLFCPHR